MTQSAIRLEHVAKSFGRQRVLDDMTCEIPEGSFSVIFGRPASGKSTVLRVIAGLEQPDRGSVHLRGSPADGVAPAQRRLAYVPQSFALYPNLKVHANIAHPLKLRRRPRAEIQEEVARLAEMLGLAPLLDRFPAQLSGGQKQRVAIARGLIKQADIYLLDDPLAGLDYKLREQLVEDLAGLKQQLNATFLYATSNALEAGLLGDPILVLEGGRIADAGDPETLYHRPRHVAVPKFLRYPPANLITGELIPLEGGSRLETNLFTTTLRVQTRAARKVVVAIYPEDLLLGRDAPSADLAAVIHATVELLEDIGAETIVHLVARGQTLHSIIESGAALGGELEVGVLRTGLRLFNPVTGAAVEEETTRG